MDRLLKLSDGEWVGLCCCGYTTSEPRNDMTGGMMYSFHLLELHVSKCKKHAKEEAEWRRKQQAGNGLG